MMPGSFQGTRTIGVTGGRASPESIAPSTVILHAVLHVDGDAVEPALRNHLGRKPDGIASQAFTTALPEAQTFLTLFAISRVSFLSFVVVRRFP